MYSFKICPVGFDGDMLPTIRRELLNCDAEIKAEFPDVAYAIDHFWLDKEESCLFLMPIESAKELDDLKHLSGAFVGCPVMALIDTENHSSLVLKAMRMGATQVVTLPLQPDDFQEAMDCIAMQTRAATSQAKSIAISGTTGGCGCTTIALNLAYEASFLGKKHCILMEMALRRGSLADHLDILPKYSTADLLVEPDRMDSYLVQQALTKITDDFQVLPGPYENVPPQTADADDAMKLINLAKPLTSVLFLDVPCLFDDLHFRALSAANQIILVVEQKVSSIRTASMICNTLGEQRPSLIINRYNPKIEGFSAKKLQDLLKPKTIWTVAQDDTIVTATNDGVPLRLASPRSSALADLDRVVADLIPESRGQSNLKTQPSLFDRLARAFTLSNKE